jgi:hypothetical protein
MTTGLTLLGACQRWKWPQAHEHEGVHHWPHAPAPHELVLPHCNYLQPQKIMHKDVKRWSSEVQNVFFYFNHMKKLTKKSYGD